MTSSSILAALESVHDMSTVERILEIPDTKWDQLRRLNPEASPAYYKRALVDYYLHTSPKVTWEALAGRCLYYDQDSAVQAIIKNRPKPKEGTSYVAIDCKKGSTMKT